MKASKKPARPVYLQRVKDLGFRVYNLGLRLQQASCQEVAQDEGVEEAGQASVPAEGLGFII